VQVTAQILGEQPAPWEDDASRALLQQVGLLRRAVLALLDRDAELRPSMSELIDACRIVFTRTPHRL
jgi:hypothetical protein